jgi:hypothetical protein
MASRTSMSGYAEGEPIAKKRLFLEYEDTKEILKMRCDLQQYNELLSRTFIDIPTLEEPYVSRRLSNGKSQKVPIDQTRKFVRRIFSRGIRPGIKGCMDMEELDFQTLQLQTSLTVDLLSLGLHLIRTETITAFLHKSMIKIIRQLVRSFKSIHTLRAVK